MLSSLSYAANERSALCITSFSKSGRKDSQKSTTLMFSLNSSPKATHIQPPIPTQCQFYHAPCLHVSVAPTLVNLIGCITPPLDCGGLVNLSPHVPAVSAQALRQTAIPTLSPLVKGIPLPFPRSSPVPLSPSQFYSCGESFN